MDVPTAIVPSGFILRTLLRNVYFINSAAYAGKSAMVQMRAEKYDGVHCGEDYHDVLTDNLAPPGFPNLCYFQTMSGYGEFSAARRRKLWPSWRSIFT